MKKLRLVFLAVFLVITFVVIYLSYAQSAEPSFVQEYLKRAEYYSSTSQLDEAVKTYRELLEKAPDYALAYYYIGKIYLKQDKYNEAIAEFSAGIPIFKKIKDASGEATCYYSIGFIYHKQSAYQEALNYYTWAYTVYSKAGNTTGMEMAYASIENVRYQMRRKGITPVTPPDMPPVTSTPTPTPVPTSSPTPTPTVITPFPTSTPTPTPSLTPIPLPTSTPTPSLTPTPLTPTPLPTVSTTTLPKSGKGKILFVRDENIWVMNNDGTDQKQLTQSGKANRPCWSRDGSLVVYDEGELDHHLTYKSFYMIHNLWTMKPDGSDKKKLTYIQERAFSPDWSPVVDRIVFCFETGIWVMSLDGIYKKKIAYEINYWASPKPCWSPDGKEIVFVKADEVTRGNKGNLLSNLWIMDETGEKQKNLTNYKVENNIPIKVDSPKWSPDGQTIVFTKWVGSKGQVLAIDVKTKETKELMPIPDSIFVTSLAWSPDGKKIAYSIYTKETKKYEIWVMNSDTTEKIKIADDGTNIAW